MFAAGHGADVIRDFDVSGGDRLDLRGLDAGTSELTDGAGLRLEWAGGSVEIVGLDASDLALAFV